MYKRIAIILLTFVVLAGCSKHKSELSSSHDINVIDLSDVKQISLLDVIGTAIIKDFKIEDGYLSEISYENTLYYVVGYAHDGAQYSYKYEVYRKEETDSILLYSSDEIIWLNEFIAFQDNLFWVEYKAESEILYYDIVQYNLANNKKTVIERYGADDVSDILLSVGEGYLIWCENYVDRSYIKIYDIGRKQMSSITDSKLCSFTPYVRMQVIDNTVSYFIEDESGDIFIEKYSINKKKKQRIYRVQTSGSGSNPVECFSNDRYAMWFTEYVNGEYYLYNLVTNELCELVLPEKMTLFSVFMDKEKLYINLKGNGNYIYSVDNDKNIHCYDIKDDFTGTHFGVNSKGGYIKAKNEIQIGIVELY